MKTFTTYAEKKAKQILNLLQGYTKGIRITAILILLLMGVNSAWAYNYGGSNVYYYFANTASWSGVHLYIWNGDWNTDFTLTKIANTNVYYYKWSSAYNNNEGILFRGAADWSHGQTSDIKANYTSHTSWVQNSTTGETDLSNINRQAKVVAMLSTGGNYTATANANCTATVSGYTVEKGKSTATSKSASTSGSANNASISAAYGSTITYTATAGTGYTFEGFSTTTSTSLPATTYTSGKTATASAYGSSNNSTYYAYFKADQYTITYKDQGGSNFSGSHATGYPTQHTYGTATTLKTATKNGYTFGGWHTDAACTNEVTSLGATAYTANITLYAKWTEIVEEKFTVTISNDGNGTTTPSGEQQVGASGISVTATPKGGYRFKNWTATTGITITNTTSATTTIKASQAGTVTANFEVERYVYFVNTARWTTIKAYAWNNSEDNGWPGVNMTKEPEKISGFDVYKYVMPAGKNYDKLVFNQGNDDGKTGDLEWVDGKYYVYSAEQWVDKNEVADLLPKPVIYFKNHLGWTNVYVYFFNTDNWGDSGASSSGLTEANGRVCKMEKVGETDIYKFDYSEKDFAPGNVIAFTKDKQPNYGNFWQTEAAYRSDYNPSMELYIPQKTSNETKNSTKYFNKGLWMKYNSTESGYSITGTINNWDHNSDKFTANSLGGYHFEAEVLLDGEKSYDLKIKNIKNDWFSTATGLTSTKNTDVEFITEHGNDAKLTTTSDGYYIFSIDLSEGKMMVSVEYPLQVNDYRMVYIESETKGTKPYTKFHPAQSIRGITEGEKLDTVSFFINKTNGQNPAILLQRCSEIEGATITWEDIATQDINGCSAVTKDAVYNFVLEQTNTGAQILAENTHLYEGNYYIRTDGAAGGWSKYNTNPDNIMTHSQTALTHGGYDYYFCEWMLKNNNVKYVVANDYSYCVSDTLAKDDIVTNENGNLPADANVRYTWNSSTNALKRAYINGSGTIADRYLVLIGNEYLKDASGNTFPVGTGDRTGLNANETTFADMGNWLYQVDIKASENTLVKLTANYNGKIQYFKGAADATVPIITGAENEYKFRLIYDFKTNYLLCGLTEDGKISENITVDEAMIMRSHHELAQTFDVTNEGSIKTIKTIYGVMNFNKSTLNGAGSEHERALYWVSFPFDVNLGEAFGFGNYGEHWIMEYYDGKERAEKGLWKEPTYSYWKYITDPTNYTLEAGKGYVLCLDLDLLKESASLWNNTDDIALYFPSKGGDITIDSNPALKETEVDAWECTIERDDRKTKDSNWNIIGVPAYTKSAKINSQNLNFYYQYIAGDDPETKDIDETNSYRVQNELTFNTMHAYMVQFAGTINWTEQATNIAALAARKSPTNKDQYTLRLALQQEGADHDHTFIRLQEDNATAEFDMNYDLCKIINSGANIYSMIGNVEVAANVLPVEERVIPLGLDIHKTGNYTFAMPDGTDGITATLIDYETGTETNLLLADYTTELREGTNNDRFALRVRPNHVATEVENTILTGDNDNAKKYIIDGALYLLRDGKLYDAQGRMIQQ